MTPLFSSALLRTQSDERLVVLSRQGHERAFEVIVDRYRKTLLRYCERALPRPKSEDVVQQVLMKAWVALQNGADVRSLKPWLYQIARTTIFDTAERPCYDYADLERSLQPADEPESELEQRAVIRRTLAGLAALPEAQREALLRTAFEGQSRAQIAEALGVSEGAVRQLLHRARTTLRTAATAVVPLPIANWIVTLGPSTAGSALESGTAGSAGVIGLVKVSAILATAGVVASGAGPVPDQHKAQRPAPKPHVVKVQKAVGKTKLALVARPGASRPASAREAAGHGEEARQQGNGSESPGGRDHGETSNRGDASGGEGERTAPVAAEADHGNGGGDRERSNAPVPDQGDGDPVQPSSGDDGGGD